MYLINFMNKKLWICISNASEWSDLALGHFTRFIIIIIIRMYV